MPSTKHTPICRAIFLSMTCLSCSLPATAAAFADGVDDARITDLDKVQVTASSGAELSEAKRAWPVRALDAGDIDALQVLDVSAALGRRVPGFGFNDVQDNPLQPDVQFRGFTGSPLLGTSEGIAAYFDGVRVNEVFGDTINWDLIPLQAIRRAEVVSGSDPVFGLNTLGGALNLQAKNGFNAAGTQLDFEAGSFGRRDGSVQTGGNDGTLGWYVLADDFREDGWRDLSPSKARHLFGTFGWHGDDGSVDLDLLHARSDLTGNGAAPVQLLDQDWKAIFTAPDQTANTLDQVGLRGQWHFGDALQLSANAYWRKVDTRAYNGDGSDAAECADNDAYLCEEGDDDPLRDQNGDPVSSDYDAINNIGRRRQIARGFTAQLSSNRSFGTHENLWAFGVEAMRGTVDYRSIVEAATLQDDRSTTSGSGIEFPDDALALFASSHGASAYFTDTFSLTESLALTAALRWNRTRIVIADRSGEEPDLNGTHDFSRANPALGIAWKISPALKFNFGYSESTRAPTPVELSCADEDAPCKLPNQFVADPALKQIVAQSWETGLSGGAGALRWSAEAFDTRNRDDILFQTTGGASSNEGFFANVADTVRRGIELDAHGEFARGRVAWFANYTLLDARFDGDFLEASANHPDADDDGTLQVRKGDRIPGLPRNQLKAGIDADLTRGVSVGIDGEFRSGAYLRGDEANLLPRTSSYAVFGVHAQWQATRNFSLRLHVDNVFDRRYANFGVLGEPDEVFPGFDDPRFLGPAAPRGAWLGARYAF